jgi:tRNA threonylcarbamoyladenosine biosynthesis protein TsaE
MNDISDKAIAWRVNVPDEQASAALAGHFAQSLEAPFVIYLQGDLGAGKTLFTRAYIHALGYEGYVKSPSYGLLETYEVAGKTILHLDLYRIEDPEELEYLAIRDLFGKNSVLMVEWPDRGDAYLPVPDMVLEFDEIDESRFINCRVFSLPGKELAEKVKSSYQTTVL